MFHYLMLFFDVAVFIVARYTFVLSNVALCKCCIIMFHYFNIVLFGIVLFSCCIILYALFDNSPF